MRGFTDLVMADWEALKALYESATGSFLGRVPLRCDPCRCDPFVVP